MRICAPGNDDPPLVVGAAVLGGGRGETSCVVSGPDLLFLDGLLNERHGRTTLAATEHMPVCDGPLVGRQQAQAPRRGQRWALGV